MTKRVTLLGVVSVLLVSVSAGCSAAFWEGVNEGLAAAQGATSAGRASGQMSELLIFGGSSHDEFLGCLNCSEYSSDSICNGYGTYGNEYSSSGMFNEYARFGNEYSSSSPWNEYSSSNSVPVVVDREGNFFGYFTINESRSDGVDFSGELNAIYEAADGDLEVVRKNLCRMLGLSG